MTSDSHRNRLAALLPAIASVSAPAAIPIAASSGMSRTAAPGISASITNASFPLAAIIAVTSAPIVSSPWE